MTDETHEKDSEAKGRTKLLLELACFLGDTGEINAIGFKLNRTLASQLTIKQMHGILSTLWEDFVELNEAAAQFELAVEAKVKRKLFDVIVESMAEVPGDSKRPKHTKH